MTATGKKPPHETLDAQLLRYWEREVTRFEGLAARSKFGWIARGYARKAVRAREMAERARAKEIARGRLPATAQGQDRGDSPG